MENIRQMCLRMICADVGRAHEKLPCSCMEVLCVLKNSVKIFGVNNQRCFLKKGWMPLYFVRRFIFREFLSITWHRGKDLMYPDNYMLGEDLLSGICNAEMSIWYIFPFKGKSFTIFKLYCYFFYISYF